MFVVDFEPRPPLPMTLNPALLPEGFRDVLPPEAAQEAALVARLLAVSAAHGYEPVLPPLAEFEEHLLAGEAGRALARQTFRVMDPISQRMMGVRADMTLQVARIARTRLGASPRPLRLAYAGPVLRVKGSQLRPVRQFMQVGAEVIGSLLPEADAEVIRLGVQSLAAADIPSMSVDLCVPTLVPTIAEALAVDAEAQAKLAAALERRDETALAAIDTRATPLFLSLASASGAAEAAVEKLQALPLPEAAEPDRARLLAVVKLLQSQPFAAGLTVDLVERRGFEYQTGLSFTIYSRAVRGVLGRGGRYRAHAGLTGADDPGEAACGVTLFMDTVIEAAPKPTAAARVFVAFGADPAMAAQLRREGFIALAALEPHADPAAEARRMGCTHLLIGQAVQKLPT
jgi:ATP phosphoribosyltransferase regulatory subunit